MAAKRVGALVVIDDAILLSNSSAVAALALKQRLPACGWSDFAIDGGLMAYGVDFLDMFRRAATFVDKIFSRPKPGDLPIERSTKFETIVDSKDRQGARPYNSVLFGRPRRSGDRVTSARALFGTKPT